MAPAIRRFCQVADCNKGENGGPYQTLEGLATQDSVLKDIELHITMAHPEMLKSQTTERNDYCDSKPDKFPRPEINEGASDTEWQYFLASWETYKRATKLKGQGICDQLWHCPGEVLKKKIFDSGIRPTDTEEAILKGIKRLCVRAHNNMVNVMALQDLYQESHETVSQFAARLNGSASICDFVVTCSCSAKVSFSENIQMFQFVKGLKDTEIQERILADAASKDINFNDVVKLSEAIEAGKHSSGALTRSIGLNRLYTDKSSDQSRKRCSYCGENWHSGVNWRSNCKASNTLCHECGRKGHLAKVCKSKRSNKKKELNIVDTEPDTPKPLIEGENASMGFFYSIESGKPFLNHVGVNSFSRWANVKIEDHPVVQITIKPEIQGYKELNWDIKLPRKVKELSSSALVDTGAQMVVIGIDHVHKMGMCKSNLIPVKLRIKAANSGGLKLLGGVLVEIMGRSSTGVIRTSRQIAYVAEGITKIFLSKQASKDLGIIGNGFPAIDAFGIEMIKNKDLDETNREINDFKVCSGLTDDCKCPDRTLPPPMPTECPFPPTIENIDRLEGWIRARYKGSTFNTCQTQPLPLMSGSPPLELFIDEDARPVACHKPSRIPIHFKDQVEKEIRRDVKLGVLEEVPPNTPTTWCSRMVIQTKKSGKPRRVIDLQPVNKCAVRQTYSGGSPFEIVSEVPPNKFRTTMDAWNGYHSVPIKEEDRDDIYNTMGAAPL